MNVGAAGLWLVAICLHLTGSRLAAHNSRLNSRVGPARAVADVLENIEDKMERARGPSSDKLLLDWVDLGYPSPPLTVVVSLERVLISRVWSADYGWRTQVRLLLLLLLVVVALLLLLLVLLLLLFLSLAYPPSHPAPGRSAPMPSTSSSRPTSLATKSSSLATRTCSTPSRWSSSCRRSWGSRRGLRSSR